MCSQLLLSPAGPPSLVGGAGPDPQKETLLVYLSVCLSLSLSSICYHQRRAKTHLVHLHPPVASPVGPPRSFMVHFGTGHNFVFGLGVFQQLSPVLLILLDIYSRVNFPRKHTGVNIKNLLLNTCGEVVGFYLVCDVK